MYYPNFETDEETMRFFIRVYLWLGLALVLSGAAYVGFYYFMPKEFSWMHFDMGMVVYSAIYLIMFSLVQRLSFDGVTYRWAIFLLCWHSISIGIIAAWLGSFLPNVELAFFIPGAAFGAIGLLGVGTMRDLRQTHWIFGTGLLALMMLGYVLVMTEGTISAYVVPMMSIVVYTMMLWIYRYELREINIRGNEHTMEESRDAIMGAIFVYMAVGLLINACNPFRSRGRW